VIFELPGQPKVAFRLVKTSAWFNKAWECRIKFMVVSLYKLYFGTQSSSLVLKKSHVDKSINHDRLVPFLAFVNQGLGISGGVAELADSQIELKNSAISRKFKLS
jgi:hypothetical protein